MAKNAIYKVNTPEGVRIVEAKSPAAAVNHCIQEHSKHYKAEALNASGLAELMKKPGTTIETVAE
jgi:hypothetical protein